MRYIYGEPIVSIVTDEEIITVDGMKAIFKTIMDNQSNIHMSYEDPEHRDYLRSVDSVRIIAVKDETIDIHVFHDKASIKYLDIPFLNVRKIRLIAGKDVIGQKYKDKVSKWHYMEVAEFSGDL